MTTSPQLGQLNFTALSPGVMILPHQLHKGILTLSVSLNLVSFVLFLIDLIIYESMLQILEYSNFNL